MGYQVEKIGPETRLFSIIGKDAIEHKQAEVFNNIFQELDVDYKMMPLNIRQDDLGFFLNGLKDSKIEAVYFEQEYWESIYTLLPCDDEEINFCKICDTIDIIDAAYRMRISIGEAIVSQISDIDNKTIILIGATSISKSVLFHLVKNRPAKIILADEIIEELIELMEFIPTDIKSDIIRIQDKNITTDADIILNFSDKEYKSDIDFKHNFDNILKSIAQINSKKWSQNG